jgi:hypothetical protein
MENHVLATTNTGATLMTFSKKRSVLAVDHQLVDVLVGTA